MAATTYQQASIMRVKMTRLSDSILEIYTWNSMKVFKLVSFFFLKNSTANPTFTFISLKG